MLNIHVTTIMETAGVEPASRSFYTQASTRVFCLFGFRASLCRQSRRLERYPANLLRSASGGNSRRIPLKFEPYSHTWVMKL